MERDNAEACTVLAVCHVPDSSVILFIERYSITNSDAFAIISDVSFFHLTKIVCNAWRDEYHMTEVVYCFTLFIPFIYYEPTRFKCGRQTQKFYHLVLSTFLRWLDSVLFIFVGSSLTTAGSCTPRLLQNRLAIDGLLMQCVFNYSFLLL